MTKTRVLFLCTHNSARSQMAEGLLRHLAGDRFEVVSAGTEATFVRPEAIEAMAELGADISGQESKALERYLGEPFDYVVTVCDDANEACPTFPGAKHRLHWSFQRRAPRREQTVTEVPIGPARWEELPRSSNCSKKPISRKTGSRATSPPPLWPASRDASWVARASSSTNPQPCCGRSP